MDMKFVAKCNTVYNTYSGCLFFEIKLVFKKILYANMKLVSDKTNAVIVSALINKKHPQAIFFEAFRRLLIS
jgi:hypothetical protein